MSNKSKFIIARDQSPQLMMQVKIKANGQEVSMPVDVLEEQEKLDTTNAVNSYKRELAIKESRQEMLADYNKAVDRYFVYKENYYVVTGIRRSKDKSTGEWYKVFDYVATKTKEKYCRCCIDFINKFELATIVTSMPITNMPVSAIGVDLVPVKSMSMSQQSIEMVDVLMSKKTLSEMINNMKDVRKTLVDIETLTNNLNHRHAEIIPVITWLHLLLCATGQIDDTKAHDYVKQLIDAKISYQYISETEMSMNNRFGTYKSTSLLHHVTDLNIHKTLIDLSKIQYQIVQVYEDWKMQGS